MKPGELTCRGVRVGKANTTEQARAIAREYLIGEIRSFTLSGNRVKFWGEGEITIGGCVFRHAVCDACARQFGGYING